jgi:PAS domain S-box-containing protein
MSFFKKEVQTKDIQPSAEVLAEIKALKLKIARLKAIQFAMPDPYYVRDMDYNVVLWPDAIAKLTGYSAAEAKKLKCYEMFKACVCPPSCQCPTQNCIKTKQFLKDVSVDVYHKSGATVHTLVSNAGIYDEDGNAIGAVEIVKDNTTIQSSMDSIGKLIESVNTNLLHLSEISEKIQNTSNSVSEKATESFASINEGEQACINVDKKVDDSSVYASNVQSSMEKINTSMKHSVEKISDLKRKSEVIIRVVDVIQNIAYKTNLLALNASIEAAKAGSFGKGFAIVANGIKELAESSSESAESIKNTIQEVIVLVQDTITSLSVTEKDVKSGTNNLSELLKFVDDMDNATKVLVGIMGRMKNVASSTSEYSHEENVATEEAASICKSLSDISKNLTREFERVFNAIRRQNMG